MLVEPLPQARHQPQAARLARHRRHRRLRRRQLVSASPRRTITPSPAPSRSTPSPSSSICSSPPSSSSRCSLARLLRRQRQPRRRVLRPGPLRRRRHDAHDLLRRAADGLHRPRDLLHLHLHPRRLPQGPGHRSESSIKYFLLGSFATAFFLYGIALAFGATGSTNIAAIAARPRHHDHAAPRLPRPRHDPHRPRLQGLRRSLPRLDARRLPGRARSGRRPDVHRAQGRRLRRAAAHHLLRLPRRCSTAGPSSSGCSPRSP